ncbi:MAG: peptidoglycan D,D-transpeptidase FtsI family protein [Bacillota bacterium]|jgi:penicillin-binding protein 2
MKDGIGSKTIRDRIKMVLFMSGVALSFLLGLLIRYQLAPIFTGNSYVEPAFLQRQEGVSVTLARGRIMDRNEIPLHSPCWNPAVAVFPTQVTVKEDFAKEAALATGLTETWLESVLDTSALPSKILRNISAAQAKDIVSANIPGLAVIPEEIRYGPFSLARHVVGHIRPNAYMNPKDNIGENGLERWFQSELAGGTPAWAGTLVTGEGQELPGAGVRIGSIRDYPKDLVTTIDVSIQYTVETILDEELIEKGAVVVLDAKTGEILAMASRPQYDQNRPEDYLNCAEAPFVNRAISDFTPGSVWKPVIIALALERGYIQPSELFVCEGSIQVGPATVKCGHSENGHGSVTVKEAIAKSCNSALIQIGLRIPPEELVEWAQTCGFGQETEVPLPDELRGLLPAPYSMLPGDVANYSIGQGYLTVTPLQMAAFYRSMINGGKLGDPTLIPGPHANEKAICSTQTCRLLQEALVLATQKGGTGEAAWVPGLGSAGKTGTAEVDGTSSHSHAWFVGWSPVMVPEYVICVFAERAGSGPALAAPIFRKIAAQLLLCQ